MKIKKLKKDEWLEKKTIIFMEIEKMFFFSRKKI